MIGSRSCSSHENRCVDCTHYSGIALLRIRDNRLFAVRSEGADADRAGRPVRRGIGPVALRPGSFRVANRWRCTVACESLRSAGAHNSWPDHREHRAVSSVPVPHGPRNRDHRRDSLGNRRVLSPAVLRRPFREEGSVAHRSDSPSHVCGKLSFALPDTPTYRYTPPSRSAQQRDSASTPTWHKKNSVYSLATIWRRPK